jgi:hypothetical protein
MKPHEQKKRYKTRAKKKGKQRAIKKTKSKKGEKTLLMFEREVKSTRNIPSHGFSTHFCIGTTREAVLPNTSKSVFFVQRSCF